MSPSPSSQPGSHVFAPRATRRDILRVGGLGCLGLSLPQLLKAEATAGSKPRAKSIVFFHHYGAPSHIDTFDPKPNAPLDIRGEFSTIDSAVPGWRVTDVMPRIASICDRLSVVRSMSHTTANHNPGVYLSLTGRTSVRDQVQVGASPDDWPHYGAVVAKYAPSDGSIPTSVQIPHYAYDQIYRCPGQNGGLLGSAYDPLIITRDPSDPQFRVTEIDLRVTANQLQDRRQLLSTLEHQTLHLDKSAALPQPNDKWNDFREQAYSLITSPKTRQAFEIWREPDVLRLKYGRTKTGQSLLLARRLVESGVRFITVFSGSNPGDGWDTHVNNFGQMKNKLMPEEDQAFAAFIEDMDARGLLEDTLVVWSGEFGRKPQIGRPNPLVNLVGPGGRDHWSRCYSLVFAGAGVKRGFVYSDSDLIGENPKGNPHTPGDVAATLFWALGIDPHQHYQDRQGRPFALADGEPIQGIFS
ncbi:MAG: DUF1501 domain-containing protein [Planctomycetales bacterium]